MRMSFDLSLRAVENLAREARRSGRSFDSLVSDAIVFWYDDFVEADSRV